MKIRLMMKVSLTAFIFTSLFCNQAFAESIITCDVQLEDVRYQPRNGHIVSFVRPVADSSGPNGPIVFCETDPVNPDSRVISPNACEHIFDMLVSAKIAEHSVTLVVETDDATIFSDTSNRVCANIKTWTPLEGSLSSVYLGQPL